MSPVFFVDVFVLLYVESGCEEWAVLSLSNAWDNHLTPLFAALMANEKQKLLFFFFANSSEGDTASKSRVRPIFVSNVVDHRIKRKYPLLLLLHVSSNGLHSNACDQTQGRKGWLTKRFPHYKCNIHKNVCTQHKNGLCMPVLTEGEGKKLSRRLSSVWGE